MTGLPARIGLLLPSREVTLWAGGDPRLLIDTSVLAEKLGLDRVWIGESLLARPRPEPLAVLAAVAARTESVGIGTAVLLPLLRHPLTLAHSLATLDRVAPGRLVVGVGPGADVPGTHTELAAVGARSDRRVRDLTETVGRWRTIWSGEDDDVDVQPRPGSPDGPPIWLAANGPKTLALAGRSFHGWVPFSPTPEVYRDGLEQVRVAVEGAGRRVEDFTAAAYLTVAIDPSKAVAEQALDSYMLAYYGLPTSIMSRIQACHAGSAESATDWIRDYIAAGAQEVIIRFAILDLTGFNAAVRSFFDHLQSQLPDGRGGELR